MSTREIGRLIRERREGQRLTVAHAAELCELSDRGLALIELGDVDPKLSSIVKIATVLEIYLGDLEACKSKEPSEKIADDVGGS